jgi:DNA polymerase-1
MTQTTLSRFRTVWFVDFEFRADPGERPQPVCLVARELRSNRLVRQWLTDRTPNHPPFDIGPDSLMVAYFASAELGCFISLGWPMPQNVLDLYVEFRCLTNGKMVPSRGLLGAMAYVGLDCMDSAEKDSMRELAMRVGPHTEPERVALLDYCQTDVDALPRLLDRLVAQIDIPRALLRGRYMGAVATMEHRGVPMDLHTLRGLRDFWPAIQERLIERADPHGVVFEGRTFKADRWARYLVRHNIPWPKLPSGALMLDDDTFRQASKRNPGLVGKWRELRNTLGQMRLSDLAVGSDGRNRCLLSPFQSRTGRNQPSNSRFIFGPSAWLRSLIKPAEGWAIAYVDWSQQEFGIAAAFSKDPHMAEAYRSGDPYLAFAKQAGAVPQHATKQSHKRERALFKGCTLGVQYGMGAESLAASIGETLDVARELLRLHRQTYPRFWRWSESAVDCAMVYGSLQTVFGWRLQIGSDANPRSLANFPCQANGAEMLRLACCLMVERGVGLCAPIHDAVLVEGPADSIEQTVADTQNAMREASAVVLGGFELDTDAEIVTHPNRYVDERGIEMWRLVLGILEDLDPVRYGANVEPNGTGFGSKRDGVSI